jgi:hypothetical protein
MQRAGHDLLPGARLAEEQYGRVRRRHLLHVLQHAAQRLALADDVVEVVQRHR